MALVAGERTLCVVTDDGRSRCRGGLVVDTPTPEGALHVDDQALCGRSDGVVTCVQAREEPSRRETPFAEWLVGPGFPCGRTHGGEVLCADHLVTEGDDAGLVPISTPLPVTSLGSAGRELLLLGADGTVWSTRPPAHGQGRLEVVGRGATRLVSDGWTQACWSLAEATVCADGRRLPRADRMAVGTEVVCGTGSEGTWCRGVDEAALGTQPADAIAAGTRFACVLRAGEVRCTPGAP